MELIWIRHFKTPGNIRHEYIGRTDETLELSEIPKNLSRYEGVEALITSPMLRCLQTAERLFPDFDPVIYEDLREMDFGDFEKKTYQDLNGDPVYQSWIDSGGMIPFPNGEGLREFQKRCVVATEKMIEDLIAKGIGRAAVVVHGGTIMATMSAFDTENREYYSFQVKNGMGYRVQVKEQEWMTGKHHFYEIESL